MARLDVDVDVSLADDLIDRLIVAAEDPRPALHAAADAIRDYEADVFRTGGFGAWPDVTAEWARRKKGRRTLVNTGGLLRSFTRYPAPHAVETIGSDSVFVGSTHVAGIMHQAGRGGPRRNPAPAPSRRYVEQWARAVLDALIDTAER